MKQAIKQLLLAVPSYVYLIGTTAAVVAYGIAKLEALKSSLV